MKYIIASDLHGSAHYCARLLARMEADGADALLLLGDILYHGPRNDLPEGYAPKEVIAMLNPLADRILCVRGNCDAEVDQMVLNFDVSTEHRGLTLFDRPFFLTHGHHINIDEPPRPEEYGSVRYVLYGHTHIPLKEERDGVWYLNPGSLSIPKNGSSHGYILLDENGFSFRTLSGEEYDHLAL